MEQTITAAAQRERLQQFLFRLSEQKVSALYTLLEAQIDEALDFQIPEEEWKLMEGEWQQFEQGELASVSGDEFFAGLARPKAAA